MATPDFVLALREKVGTHPLWLSGVTAVVLRDGDSTTGTEVLLVRRSDTGAWTPVTGIIDPGEEPAVAAAREILEEANVVATVDTLVWVKVTDPVRYENGDESQYLDLIFRCSYVSGDAFPADGENTEAAWFALNALPTISEDMRGRVMSAVETDGTARFEV
ncbi:NUDIX domain-containing protein [Conyzicola nivalis]|uniref:MutT/NUDIX-family protein n=1 Tax=Conyzicola nivalis TaxID=1477021 RepID=A0A916SPA3_9MICO|nr:NUDIX domain-containing protein [Conyzicola nivalis]GGB09855.1 putative MutT/NUDIX-family protein [Conyzicola nivalis]